MRYLLDTNICIYVINQKPPTVLDRFKKEGVGNVAIDIDGRVELVRRTIPHRNRRSVTLAGHFGGTHGEEQQGNSNE